MPRMFKDRPGDDPTQNWPSFLLALTEEKLDPRLRGNDGGGVVRTIIRRILVAPLIPAGLYLAAEGILGRIPINNGWTEPATGITIFVQSNGVHTGIVLPAGPGRWRAYGWGDRDFYLNTPRWRDMRPGTALNALTGSGRTVMHVDDLDDFAADDYWRPLHLRPDEYRRLRAAIAASFIPGGKAIPGYTPRDRFYPARGGYSAITTCNVWTGRVLKAAGVKIGAWTPFAGDVMRWVPHP